MDRRVFLGSIASAAAAGGLVRLSSLAADDPPGAMPPKPSKWPDEVYRRSSVDIHVPDWDPALLSRFEPAEFVEILASGGVQSYLHYAKSLVGLCLWKTTLGPQHKAMKDRDFLAEVVAECRKRYIHPLVYFNVVYDNWAFAHDEDWRWRSASGVVSGGRIGLVCINSPYRDHVTACTQEICGRYDIDGIFFDMTQWPGVCYCRHCAERFQKEHGKEIPRALNWLDPTWRLFQKAREGWLLEFAKKCTATAKKARPTITVNHQFATVFSNWWFGAPLELRDACDYVGGDFYGGPTEHSLACKAYHGLTPRLPFEFHTSRTRIYSDHVTVKPMEEIRTEALVATLHSAALMIVDYINVDGTLNRQAHEFLGRLSGERAVYEPFLGGDLAADVAIYYDKNSMYDPFDNNINNNGDVPHKKAVVGAAKILQAAHIPFGVVTNVTLDQLSRYRAAILPWVAEMTPDQAEVFRKFVAGGGQLYASGPSSLQQILAPSSRFLLEDVLGVRYVDVKNHAIFYLTPDDAALKKAVWPQDHVSHVGAQVVAEALPGAEVLARITLPFVDPALGTSLDNHFAAILSNPPALSPTDQPAIVRHRFGQGETIWVAGGIETGSEWVNRQLTVALLRRILNGPFRFEVDTHPAVEMTLFDQADKHRLLAGLLNLQQQLPQVPVPATVRVLPPSGTQIRRVRRLPNLEETPTTQVGSYVQFQVAPFDALAMFLLEY